jgi:hypothetical protein
MIKNDTNKAGMIASKPQFFMLHQIKVAAIHTRFDSVQWFVWDAGIIDELTGHPEVVGQYDTEEDAIKRAKYLADRYESELFSD